MNSAKLTVSALFVAGFAVSIASIVLMAFAFFSESILGHGVSLAEPNRFVAFGELAACGYGMFFALYMLKTFFANEETASKAEAKEEPTGYAKNDGMYA